MGMTFPAEKYEERSENGGGKSIAKYVWYRI